MKVIKCCLAIVGGMSLLAVAYYCLASKDAKQDVLAKIEDASGTGEALPKIVREQQRKERARQNSTWTAENRALHPIEFCQAQLAELDKFAARLEASAHEVACKKAEVTRTLADNEAMISSYEKFLKEAKAAYRTCEQANAWPAKIGGYALSEEKIREKIVNAAQRIPSLKMRCSSMRNQLTAIEKRASVVMAEQKRLDKIRESVQMTIGDLRLKKVIDGDNGVAQSLNAISDQMGTLGVDYDDPKIDDLVLPDPKAARDVEFEKIMAEP